MVKVCVIKTKRHNRQTYVYRLERLRKNPSFWTINTRSLKQPASREVNPGPSSAREPALPKAHRKLPQPGTGTEPSTDTRAELAGTRMVVNVDHDAVHTHTHTQPGHACVSMQQNRNRGWAKSESESMNDLRQTGWVERPSAVLLYYITTEYCTFNMAAHRQTHTETKTQT